MRAIKKGVAISLPFLMVDSTDRITGKTGLTPTVRISKNLSAFSVPQGTVSEVGFGIYKLDATVQDLDTLGWLILHAEAPGALNTDEYYYVVNFDPFNQFNLGLEYLDDRISNVLRSAVNVIVQPISSSILQPIGNGGTILAFTKNRIKATWYLEQDITGSVVKMLIFTSLEPDVIVMEIPNNYFVIQSQPNGRSVLKLDAPDTYVPNINTFERTYRYIIKETVSDSVLLYGSLLVQQSPQ